MKYPTPLLVTLIFVWAVSAQAQPLDRVRAAIQNSIEIQGGSSPRMNVTFKHAYHIIGKGISCTHCHHDRSLGSSFVSCRNEDCHATPGARERDTMSMFMAFHDIDTDRSCYGCHTRQSEENPDKYPEFQGCRPCHMSPQTRETTK